MVVFFRGEPLELSGYIYEKFKVYMGPCLNTTVDSEGQQGSLDKMNKYLLTDCYRVLATSQGIHLTSITLDFLRHHF